MDHLFFLSKFEQARLPFREHSFLNNSRRRPAVRESVAELRIADDGAPGAPPRWDSSVLVVSAGTCFSEIAEALRAREQAARVLRVAALDLRKLCPWLGTADAVFEFNRAASTALHHTVRFCAAEQLTPAPAAGEACPWGYRPPSALPLTEAAAREYVASRPDASVASFTEPRACKREGDALAYTCS
jgi:hypothetical protein